LCNQVLFPVKPGNKEYFFCSGEILSLAIFFRNAMKVTPSLPQRGRQHAGIIPLTPSSGLIFPSTF